MRIAFVGKGGSGKSTLASQFCKYLIGKDKNLLVLDADLNMHMRHLLNIINWNKNLTDKDTQVKIKKYIKGNNNRIKNFNSIINTTPPGRGTRFITLRETDELLNDIAYKTGKTFFLQIGVPIEYSLGIRCYHVNMEIAETLLAHTNESREDFVVVDMTAGADAFATSMYSHFDALFVVVEPTFESVSVYQDYLNLGKKFGIVDKIIPIGNQIEDESDILFLKSKLKKIKFFFQKSSELKTNLREDKSNNLIEKFIFTFDELYKFLITNIKIDKNSKLKRLQEMHRIVSQKPHNIAAYGDLREQIDDEFFFS